jgi:dipeptidyl aminopeptidase/acylaminoacyl peptidase
MTNLGVDPGSIGVLAQRMRSFGMWREIWEDLAAPHLGAIEIAVSRGDRAGAIRAIQTSLVMLDLAYGGDNHYVYTPQIEQRKVLPLRERLYAQLRELTGAQVECVSVPHASGVTSGWLHLPKGVEPPYPVLLGIHPLSGTKDSYDVALAPFRDAGYATFCIDLPAHGENFDGPRLQPDDEQVAVAALEILAARPDLHPKRLGVIGGSLGGFFTLRTAAASPRVKAALAYCPGFDIGSGVKLSVRGIRENFAWVIGANTMEETVRLSRPFHLRHVLGHITCPVALVHGTQDHICDFAVTYRVAARVKAPLTVIPLVGVDHEASYPSAPHIAQPGIDWLKVHL